MTLNIDDIPNNGILKCFYCGIEITPATNSGWEAFTPDSKTQYICVVCHEESLHIDATKVGDDDTL